MTSPIKKRVDAASTPEEKLDIINSYARLQIAQGRNVDLSNMDLRGVDFRACGLEFHTRTVVGTRSSTDEDGNTTQTNKDYRIRTFFNNSDLTGAIFTGVNCSGISFKKSLLAPGQLDGVEITGADLRGTVLSHMQPAPKSCCVIM